MVLFTEENMESLKFNKIHESVKFSSIARDVFVPSEDVTVTFVNYERELTTHVLNPNL